MSISKLIATTPTCQLLHSTKNLLLLIFSKITYMHYNGTKIIATIPGHLACFNFRDRGKHL